MDRKNTPSETSNGSLGLPTPKKGEKCPACGSRRSRVAAGDDRIRVCSECDALWIQPPGHGHAPKGIRKGRRCLLCGSCTIAVRDVIWIGGTVRVHACRNEECGNVYVVPLSVETLGANRIPDMGGYSPIEVPGGLTDLLDQVRR